MGKCDVGVMYVDFRGDRGCGFVVDGHYGPEQKKKKLSKNNHSIIHFPTSNRVSGASGWLFWTIVVWCGVV